MNKKRKYHLNLLLLLTIFTSLASLHAQKIENTGLKAQIDAGYIFGGMIYNYNFIYNPAYYLDISAVKLISKKEILGLSIGYMHFQENERFYPIKIKILGLTKKNKDCIYYSFGTGYAFAEDRDFNMMSNYDLKGGALFDFGFGRKFKIYKTNLLLGVSYMHQFAKIKYETIENKCIKEPINYDLLKFNIGIIL